MQRRTGKRILSLCMAVVLLLGMCTGLAGCGSSTDDAVTQTQKDPDAVYVTRGEWIRELAQMVGLTNTVTDAPYFTDIHTEDELFTYVQSAADWALFEELGVAFEPDAEADREFVIATAVIAADVLEDAGYIEPNEDYENRKAVDYSICLQYFKDQGHIDSLEESYLSESVDTDEAYEILNWVQNQALNMAKEEKFHIEWQENVIDLSEYTSDVVVGENEVVISAAIGVELQPGDVFMTAPTKNSLVGEARKVVSVSENAAGDSVVTTQQPELGEIVQELQITQTAVPDYDNIIFYDENIELLLENRIDTTVEALPVFSFENTNDWNPFTVDIESQIDPITFPTMKYGVNSDKGLILSKAFKDENSKMEKTLHLDTLSKFIEFAGGSGIVLDGKPGENPIIKKVDKYESEVYMENTLHIDKIVSSLDLNLSAFGMSIQNPVIAVKEVGIKVDFNMKDTFKMGGAFKSGDTLKIATIPFVYYGVAQLDADLKAYVDGNGYLEFVFDFGGEYTFDYKRFRAPKFTAKPDNKPVKSKAAIDLETGMDMDMGMKLFGIDVMQVGFKTGVLFNYEAKFKEDVVVVEEGDYQTTTTTGLAKNTLTATFPIVKAYAKSKILEDLVEYEAEEELIGKNGSAKKIKPKEIWSADEVVIYEIVNTTSVNGIQASDGFEDIIAEFVNSPANAQCSYDNFYEKSGVENFTSHLLFLENPDDLSKTQQYIAGTNFSYTEEDLTFGDGSTLSGGAQLCFETQDADRWDRDYSIIWYEEGGLQRIRTDRVHTDSRDAGIVGNVGGFSDFLAKYRCATLADCIEVFGLGTNFASELESQEPDYHETINSKTYGAVEVYLNYYVDFTSEVKELILVFRDDSGCPYKEIFIDERLANTLTAAIPILRVEAYTPLAYQ